jgi:1-acyl-sn-glycerol-3-phosphate acyltransferase
VRILGNLFYAYLYKSFEVWLGYYYRWNRKKHTTGMEKIPQEAPVIFCCNHPNAFMDAIMIGISTKRRSWFLARSDAFRKKGLANFLMFIGIIPIYRLLEGAENLQKNDETFDKCSRMLEEKKAIMIFSEGLCIQERRLRKLKKGTARIAFGSEEKNNFNLGLMIVPVGINYSSTPWRFRSTVTVEFGDPYPMSDYKELYQQDKARAMNQFTRDLEGKMRKLLVVIENKEHDELVNTAEEMLLTEWSEEAYLDPKNQKETHTISKKIAHIINVAAQHEPERVQRMSEKAKSYNASLKKFGLRDWLLNPKTIHSMGAATLLADFLFFFFLFPFWVFGVITNYLPYKIPNVITKKVVKHIEWYASINGTAGVYIWQIFYGLELLAVALIFRNWYVLGAFAIAMPVCGVIAQAYWVRIKKSRGRGNLMKAFKSDRAEIEKVIGLRAEIVSEMESLREQYASAGQLHTTA